MKKTISIVLATMLILAVFAPLAIVSNAADKPVTNVTKSISYDTIQEAIDAADENDTISVAPGNYDLGSKNYASPVNGSLSYGLLIRKSIKLIGPKAGVDASLRSNSDEEAILTSSVSSYNSSLVLIARYDVSVDISGFTFASDAWDTISCDDPGVKEVNISYNIFKQKDGSTAKDKTPIKLKLESGNISNNSFNDLNCGYGIRLIEIDTRPTTWDKVEDEQPAEFNVDISIQENSFENVTVSNSSRGVVDVRTKGDGSIDLSGNTFSNISNGYAVYDSGSTVDIDVSNNYWGSDDEPDFTKLLGSSSSSGNTKITGEDEYFVTDDLLKVTFDSQGGTNISAVEGIIPNTKISAVAAPLKAFYIFDAWYTDKSYSVKWDFSNPVTESMTLFAKWIPEPREVTYKYQDGRADSIVKSYYGAILEIPTKPAREGFGFDGWYKEAECINAWNFSSDVLTDDLTLYAKWIVISIGLNLNTAILQKGDSLRLTATIEPAFEAARGLNFTSSNPSVATVDANGYVKALSYGEAVITATVAGTDFSASCKVIVTGISLDKDMYSMSINMRVELFASLEYGDLPIVWKSSNKNIALVDQNGEVYAVRQGETTITATIEGTTISDSSTIYVGQAEKTQSIIDGILEFFRMIFDFLGNLFTGR